jgi:hypothetical protein
VSVSSDYTSGISLGYFYFMASFAVYIKDLPSINLNIFSIGWRSLLISILEGIKAIFNSLKSNNGFMHIEGDDFNHDQSKGPVEKNNHIYCMNNPNSEGSDSASRGTKRARSDSIDTTSDKYKNNLKARANIIEDKLADNEAKIANNERAIAELEDRMKPIHRETIKDLVEENKRKSISDEERYKNIERIEEKFL